MELQSSEREGPGGVRVLFKEGRDRFQGGDNITSSVSTLI